MSHLSSEDMLYFSKKESTNPDGPFGQVCF